MTAEVNVVKTRVLMIEDNPVDVDLLQIAFDQVRDWPLEIEVADNGEKAIRLLQLYAESLGPKPHMIILDLNIPRRDGTEVLHVIRSTQALASLPVAVLSSSPNDIIQRKLTAAGVTADGHFTKPHSLEEFMKLGQILRHWYEDQRKRSQNSADYGARR